MTPTQTAESLPRKMIPISRITRDPSIQVRVKLNKQRIEDYQKILADVGEMDPVTVFVPDPANVPKGEALLLADGFQRCAAYEASGKESIPVRFRQGGHSEALEFAIYKNGHHGAALTNEEKRRAAILAVEDPVLAKYTDSKLSKLIGVSASLVNDCRRGITKDEKRRRKEVTVSKHRRAAPQPKTRTPKDLDNRPTARALMAELQGWIDSDQVDEAAVIGMFETAQGEYKFCGKAGVTVGLKVTGKSGKVLCDVAAIVKSIDCENIVLKLDSPGTIAYTKE